MIQRSSTASESVATMPGQHAVHSRSQDRANPRRPRVLVVDDDPHDREIYGRILCYNGFDVLFAATAAAAFHAADRWPIDLILLDVGLPDMSGLALIARLRRLPRWRSVPAIALSGFRRDSLGNLARQAGCDEFIEKPASPVEVLHAVERRLGRAPLPGDGSPPQVVEVTG
jgi:CheY-like chemotaxis protein